MLHNDWPGTMLLSKYQMNRPEITGEKLGTAYITDIGLLCNFTDF